MNTPKFSFALIARNEEKTLPRLVASLKEFQERGGIITLLDTGSTDKTAEVARNLGCIVHEVGNKFLTVLDKEMADAINNKFIIDNEKPIVKEGDKVFDFASARNYVAEFAPTDFIATPDCDEIWTKFDIDVINKHIEDGAEQFEYEFVFAHNKDGSPSLAFKHSKFYDKRKLTWKGRIHEVLSGNAKRVYLPESVCKLEHFQNVETNRSGYLTGLALSCYLGNGSAESPDRAKHYFARELMYHGRFKSAINQFLEHIEMNGWVTERSQSMVYIGDCYYQLGNVDEAFKWYTKAFDLEPNRREPLMKMAEHYYRNKKALQSIPYAVGALEIKGGNFYSNFQPYYENIPHEILYWAYWQIGEKEKSKEHFFKALSFSPMNPKYLSDKQFYPENNETLPTVCFIIPQLGREDGLKRCLDSIAKLNYPAHLMKTVVINGDQSVPVKVKLGVEKSNEDWIVFAANDMEFDPQCIKNALEDAKQHNKSLIAFNDGPVLSDEGNICTHFMIKRSFLPEIGGDIFDTDFHHVGVDNLLWAKCVKLNQAFKSKNAKFIHHHFSKTGKEMDAIYKKGWENAEKDRQLLKIKLAAL